MEISNHCPLYIYRNYLVRAWFSLKGIFSLRSHLAMSGHGVLLAFSGQRSGLTSAMMQKIVWPSPTKNYSAKMSIVQGLTIPDLNSKLDNNLSVRSYFLARIIVLGTEKELNICLLEQQQKSYIF